jgi:predicted membrane protein
MVKHIKKFMSQLNDQNFRLLYFELLLFFVLFGIAYRSWLVLSLVLVGLSWLMSRPKGTVYMIFALSSLWGFIAFSIGYSLGWGWASVLGLAFFLVGITAHTTGLTRPLDRPIPSRHKNANDWRRNWYLDQPNLN